MVWEGFNSAGHRTYVSVSRFQVLLSVSLYQVLLCLPFLGADQRQSLQVSPCPFGYSVIIMGQSPKKCIQAVEAWSSGDKDNLLKTFPNMRLVKYKRYLCPIGVLLSWTIFQRPCWWGAIICSRLQHLISFDKFRQTHHIKYRYVHSRWSVNITLFIGS